MPERTLVVELPWRTIFKVLAAAALVWVWLRTWELVLLLTVAVLLAVTLDPVVQRVERRGLPRWGAATLVAFSLLMALSVFLYIATTSLPTQWQIVATRMVSVEHDLASRVPAFVRDAIGTEDPADLAQTYVGPLMLRLTKAAGRALLVFALAFILMVYLLIEGRATYQWLLAFVPLSQRAKVAQTAVESQRVIFGYVAGNIATSIFATLFVLASLTLLHIPAALLLAVLAGLCDFVPVVGFMASLLPAVVLALAVSPVVALTVVVLYVAYHTLENYLIAPLVYGDRLRLSNVAVVLAFAVGATLAGVIGALIALPVAAAYPAIERIWLSERLGEQVVQEHAAIEQGEE
jgi:predicted PurR-regulated permease PerM